MTGDSTITRPAPDARGNSLLNALPADLRDELTPLLTPVRLKLGEVLHESGAAQQYVWFPIDSIVSRTACEAGGAAGTAFAGNFG